MVMPYFRVQTVSFLTLLSLVVICLGCAGQGTPQNGPRAAQPGPLNENQPVSQESPEAVANKADQILDLRIDDSPGVTLVRITGNAPLQGYEFRRSSESQFVLDLNDIKPGGALSSLPIASDQLTINYGGMASPKVIQLVGTLQKPLDYYVLDAVGNELILTLHVTKAASAPPEAQPLPTRSASKASGKVLSGNSSDLSQPALSGPLATLPPGDGNRPGSRPAGVQGTRSQKDIASGSKASGEFSKKQYAGKPISLDLMDADLKNVLRLLSDITGTNMVIEPDVAGRVTIKVEKVPWDQVLDMILAMNELGKEELGNVIRIAKLAKLKQEWNRQVEQIKAKQELMEVAKDVGVITTAYLTVNYAQPVEIASKIAENKSERGKVSVDERSSLIIYSDYPNRLEAARNLLSRLDRATAQVLIEARIVTTSQEITRALGTEWNLKFEKYGLSPTPGTRIFEVNQPPEPFLGIAIAGTIGQTLVSLDFKLSALETASQLNIVAAPRVLTINHVKAVITQGQQIPYLVRSDYGSSSTQFKDAVVELQVIPHITPDQKVRLEIQAKQDEPTAKDYQVGDSSVPGIDTRKITTELLVDDGKVVVIGGVMRGREEESNRGIPGFKNIPLLGWLFNRTETQASQKTELLIFISPHIVETTGLSPRG